MKKHCFFSLFLLLLIFLVHAQDHRAIDSLNQAYAIAEHDTLRINTLLEIAGYTYRGNPDTAIVVCENALEIADNGNLIANQAECYAWLGYLVNVKGDVQLALEYDYRALEIQENIIEQKSIDGKTLLNDAELISFKKAVATSFNNIGSIYDYQGDIPRALQYYHKSLKIREGLDDKKGIGYSLNNIGFTHKAQGNNIEALEYYFRSLKIREEIGHKSGIATSLNNIGFIYSRQDQDSKALEYYYKSLEIREEIGYKAGIAAILNNVGGIELAQGAVTTAFQNGTKGLRISREIGSPLHISANADLLSKVAKRKRNYKEALEMYELHIQMRDSVKNEETQKAAIRQQTKYEFEKVQLMKDQEEQEVTRLRTEAKSRRDNLQYSVILIALLVLFGGVLSLGFINLSIRMSEGIIFFSFLILFEFLLVLADPYIEGWSGGAPGIKLLFNAAIAAFIFPAHAFFESRLKGKWAKGGV
ncbi:MAG: tetratricopeptide repeat protein [Flavobacteriales bacterium]|nr:tetratricopeptide repeat protein [Flavobacteriales bacterium]